MLDKRCLPGRLKSEDRDARLVSPAPALLAAPPSLSAGLPLVLASSPAPRLPAAQKEQPRDSRGYHGNTARGGDND